MTPIHKVKVILVLSLAIGFTACTRPEKKVARISDPEAVRQLNEFASTLKGGGARLGGNAEEEMSVASFESGLQRTKEQLQALRSIDTSKLAGEDLTDWKFTQSILAGRALSQEKIQSWKKDPRIYMTFSRLSTALDKPGDSRKKIEDLTKKLRLCKTQMENGVLQLQFYVPRFHELGVFMAENGFVFFDKELTAFIASVGSDTGELKNVAQDAREALTRYFEFLKNELPQRTKADFAIGADSYNEMLKVQYLLGYDADSLYDFGWKQFNNTLGELEALARKMDSSKTWQQLAVGIKNEYPDPHKMIEVHQQWVDKCKEHVIKNNLIPIPWKEQVKVVERAEYLRKTSYYGHFSFAKEKDADSIYTSEMHINPFEDQWDNKRKNEYLVEHDYGVIMVTAPHETYCGHHIQGLYQINNPRPLRRENSISIFSEGWGLYNEQLFRETGFFLNDKILLRQLQLRLWRNARVIYDVGLHTGKMSYEDAVDLMTNKVGFLLWASQLEIDASTTSPGYFIGYFTGMMEILKMREEYKAKMGDKFSLSDFHERLLKIGSMPFSLMRESMFAEDLK